MKVALSSINETTSMMPLKRINPVTSARKSDQGSILFTNVQERDCYLSFKSLFECYYKQVLFFARKYVESIESAEEVINDVFLKLWNKRKDIKIKGSFQSYLFSSVRNKCIDYLRKQNDIQFEGDHALILLESTQASALDMIHCEELQEKIEAAIGLLPTDRRRVFLMSRNDGLMYKEIASKLNISIKTVETQMGRSLRFLREHLKAELNEYHIQ